MTPSQILSKLCRDYHLDGPFYSNGQVRIENVIFTGGASALNGNHNSTAESLTFAPGYDSSLETS